MKQKEIVDTTANAGKKNDAGKPAFHKISPKFLYSLAEALQKHAGTSEEELIRLDLLPIEPLIELAKLYGIGALKYESDNWRRGLLFTRMYRSMMSHAIKWYMRMDAHDRDSLDGQHHLDSVAWYALGLREFHETHPELDDRPSLD